MDKQIMKPMSVARAEFINNLTALINSSMLPPFVIEPILKDMYRDMSVVSKQQLERDMEQYQRELNDSNTDGCEN